MSGFISNTPTHSVASGTNVITFSPGSIADQLISVYLLEGTSPVPVAPIDSSGDVWTLLSTNNSGPAAETIAIAYLLTPSATASRTLTWATAGAPSTHGISEWNGITAAGGTPVYTGLASSGTLTSASYTPSQANEVVIAMLSNQGTSNPDNVSCTSAQFQTIGSLSDHGSSSCICVQQNGSSFNSGEANAAIVTSASALTVSWSLVTQACFSGVAGFKYTPGGGGGTAPFTPFTQTQFFVTETIIQQ